MSQNASHGDGPVIAFTAGSTWHMAVMDDDAQARIYFCPNWLNPGEAAPHPATALLCLASISHTYQAVEGSNKYSLLALSPA